MRVKRGLNKNRRHKATLEAAKGYRLTYSKLYRRAKEALLHAGQYAFAHRRKRKGQFRRLWIERINAGLENSGISYSIFIKKLKASKVELNRKVLADLALNQTQVFNEVVKSVQ